MRVAAVAIYQPKGGGRYSASIMPGRQVTLAFRVSGIVTDIYRVGGRGLETGDMVAAGTILARIREDDYRNSTAQAQSQLDGARDSVRSATAQLAQTQASRIKAEADFARAKKLYDSQSLTRPEFDSAKAQLDVSAAQVDAARAQIDSASAQIRNGEAAIATARLAQQDTALVAPFSASVVQRNVELGMLAGPSQAAYTLADIGTVKAVFGVPDNVVVQLRQGKGIDITVEALPGSDFHGTVTAIASVADKDTRLFQIEVTLSSPAKNLKPGMIASLSLGDAQQTAAMPVVPLSAVMRDPSLQGFEQPPSVFPHTIVSSSAPRQNPPQH